MASSTGPQTGSNIGLVAGAAAGGVIGILVVVVAAIILVLLYRRRKRGIYKIPYGQPQDDHILANPLYQGKVVFFYIYSKHSIIIGMHNPQHPQKHVVKTYMVLKTHCIKVGFKYSYVANLLHAISFIVTLSCSTWSR